MPRKTSSRTQSGLFGIINSNRNTSDSKKDHWGKNRFNSSFPTALACFMMENGMSALYNELTVVNEKLEVVTNEIPLSRVFNTDKLAFEELFFDFEARFEPYQQYALDTIDGVDLVVKRVNGDCLAPVEIKLTVMPDSTTLNQPEAYWGCELVVRSATTAYCAMGMFDSILNEKQVLRNIFEDTCSNIEAWTSSFEMSRKTCRLSECIDVFQKQYLDKQKPLVMQPIWRTKGQSPILADQAFDILIWSDHAFSRLFVDRSYNETDSMSRDMRATARLARCIWELSKSGKTRLADIYKVMTYGLQNDKEFSISGTGWRNYVSSKRIDNPMLHKNVIEEIIQPGYLERLRPERRFDQTLYFTMRK